MKNKNYVWIIEVKTSTRDKYEPLMGTFGKTFYTGLCPNRHFARIAAKYMNENNQYNHPRFPSMVKYRVAKYKKI